MTAIPPEEITDLAAGYIRYAEELAQELSPDSPEITAAERAYDLVEKTVRNGAAERAWRLVVEILRQASDERLDVYAAGPLEDLVKFRGPEVIEAIEREARPMSASDGHSGAFGCWWARYRKNSKNESFGRVGAKCARSMPVHSRRRSCACHLTIAEADKASLL